MIRTTSLLILALAAGCANSSKTGPATGASVASAPVPVASAEPRDVTPTPTPTLAASAPPAASAAPDAETPAATAVSGKIDSRFEGCLAQADPEAAKSRAMVAEKPDRVDVAVEGRAIRVAHHLNHACCLKAETRLERAGKAVTLVEQLGGTPCRCRCASVITSQIPLPSGDYDLHVRLEVSGAKTEVHHQPVQVSDAPAAPKLPPKIRVNLGGPKP